MIQRKRPHNHSVLCFRIWPPSNRSPESIAPIGFVDRSQFFVIVSMMDGTIVFNFRICVPQMASYVPASTCRDAFNNDLFKDEYRSIETNLDISLDSPSERLYFYHCNQCYARSLVGAERFYKNIEVMIGYRINPWMKICWLVLAPMIVAVSMKLSDQFKLSGVCISSKSL